MPASIPAIEELLAPLGWQSVELISDLHLQREEPETVVAFERYLRASTADAIFMLGDLFEVWVGDDSMDEVGSFEAEVCAVIAEAAKLRPMFFMHGNRDFLVGRGFAERTGVRLLADPTVFEFASERWLLTHGDALCLDDVEYQKFRLVARNPQWQEMLLALPLAQRRAQGRSARAESEARKRSPEAFYGDVDTASALQWLAAANSQTLIHGHTHRPAEHELTGNGMHARRIVLSDWDLAADNPRAEVIRLSPNKGLERVSLVPM